MPPAPELIIDGFGDAEPTGFWTIVGVVRYPSGHIAIADGGSTAVHIFTDSGDFLRTLGGPGPGPREFGSLWAVFRVGGSSLVGVDGLGRGEIFSVHGRHAATVPIRMSPTGQRIRPLGYFQDGSYLGYVLLPVDVGSGQTALQEARLFVVDPESGGLNTLGIVRAQTVARARAGPPRPLVYGPRLHAAVSGDSYCLGFSDEYAITCFDRGGDHELRLQRRGAERRPVTESDRRTYFSGMDAANPGPRGAEFRRALRQRTRFASHMPPFGRIVLSSDGHIWVGPVVPDDETLGELNSPPETPQRWSVYSRDGGWRADVVLPAGFRLMDAGPRSVVGVTRDETGVERIAIYPVQRVEG